jgi:hypothetical protein
MKHLLAFLALALPLHADPRNVDVSFFCLKFAAGTHELHTPQQTDPIQLSTANITVPVTVSVENDEAVFHTGPIVDPKQLPPLAAKVHIPKNLHKALVVLVPAPKSSGQAYHGLVIDHGEDFKMGTYRVINFSQRSIRGAIGKSFIEARSGASANLALEGEPGAVQGVRFEFHDGERWNRLTETRCSVRKDRRWLLCVFQEPGGRMNMRSIPDRTNLLVPVNAAEAGGTTSLAN